MAVLAGVSTAVSQNTVSATTDGPSAVVRNAAGHATPPKGWNSYTGYSIAVTEAELLKNIDFLSEKLLPYGYDTVTVDNGWFLSGQGEGVTIKLDAYGRPDAHEFFFPNGLKYTIDYAHKKGMKFGIWLLRGINRRAVEENLPVEGTPYRMKDIVNLKSACPWAAAPWWNYGVDMTKPGAQEYYDGLVKKYADLGVDFIKFDDIVPNPVEVEAVAQAIKKCGRPIVLSLSPGDEIKVGHSDAYKKANMVRITSDIWDNRGSLEATFNRWEAMQDYTGPEVGSFLDMDMVCFGRLYVVNKDGGWECKFTQDQKRTFMVQRALAASPLMLGGVMYRMDAFSLSLFTHPGILQCDQNGVIGRLVHRAGKVDVWRTSEYSNEKNGWIGVFNRDGTKTMMVERSATELGLAPERTYILKDLWSGSVLPASGTYRFEIPADGVAFLRYEQAVVSITVPEGVQQRMETALKRFSAVPTPAWCTTPELKQHRQIIVEKCIRTLYHNYQPIKGDILHEGVVPSPSSFNGLWAWDSWKHAYALAGLDRALAENSIRAMFDYQDDAGMIADNIKVDKSQGNFSDTKPPLSVWAVGRIQSMAQDTAFAKEMYPKLLKYHYWWYQNRDHDQNGLCEYGAVGNNLQAARWESGWDNAIRFDEAKMVKNNEKAFSMDIESADLNAYLYLEKERLAQLAKLLQDDVTAKKLEQEKKTLGQKIQKTFFDPKTGFFYDVRLADKSFILSKEASGWIPLFAGAATQEQAARVKDVMMDEASFNTRVPLPTASKDNPRQEPQGYWRGPVWIDQFYFGYIGLKKYGYHPEAETLLLKLLKNAEGITHPDGKPREHYNPLTGAGLGAEMFGWTASSLLMMMTDEVN